jgi:general secretion pathway protein D
MPHLTSTVGAVARTLSAATLLLAVGAALPACVSDERAPVDTDRPPRAFREAPPYDNADRPITQLLRTRNTADLDDRTEVLDSRTFSAPPERSVSTTGFGRGAPGELVRVKLALNDAPADEVVRTIVGEYLGRDLILPAPLDGVVTMDLDDQLTTGDVFDLLNTLASLYGWVVEDRSGAIVVRASTEEALRSPETPILLARSLASDAQPAIRVRRMRHLDPASLAGGGGGRGGGSLLESLLSPSAIVGSSGRLLVMVDTTAQLNKAASLLNAIDVPAFDGVRMETLRLAHRTPEDAEEVLGAIAQNAGFAGANEDDAPLSFVPIPASDRLVVLARDASMLTYGRTLVEQFDRPDAAERRYRFLYNIQHADAGELESFITAAFNDRIESDRSVTDTDKMQLTWGSTGGGGGLAGAGSEGVATGFGQSGRVLIHATYDDYVDLMEAMRALDRPPQQAVLQTVIAEVSLSDSLEFGVEYFLESLDEDGFGTLELSATPGLVAEGGTGSAFFVGGSGLAVVQALQSETSLNIIQQPTVTLVDGGVARFQVGGETPVATSEQDTETQIEGDTTFRREIEFRDTGIILTLQADIAESGAVRLLINLENRLVGPATELGPEFITRILETEVVVPHGQTLVLAGFIDDSRNRSKSKTPVLGDIPGVGAAFTNIDNEDSRNELFLTITPEIINNPNRSSRTVSNFLDAAERMRLVLASSADDLPVAMLRDPALDQPGPAVQLRLPQRPVDGAQQRERDGAADAGEHDAGTSDAEPLKGAGDGSRDDDADEGGPLDELPEDTPEIIKELLRSGSSSAAQPETPDVVDGQLATPLAAWVGAVDASLVVRDILANGAHSNAFEGAGATVLGRTVRIAAAAGRAAQAVSADGGDALMADDRLVLDVSDALDPLAVFDGADPFTAALFVEPNAAAAWPVGCEALPRGRSPVADDQLFDADAESELAGDADRRDSAGASGW